MRWVVRVFALGVTMVVLHRAAAPGPLEARAALALGFLLSAAWLGTALARRTRVPPVTGFLLLGFCIGPGWLGLVRADEAGALAFIGDASLALVALAAGSTLSLRGLADGRRALGRLMAGTIALPFGAVALVTLSVSHWFPLTIHQPFTSALAFALALAAVAVAPSPVLAAAVIDEPGARGEDAGPLARAVLAVTAGNALCAVVLLALALAVAGWLSGAGAMRGGLGTELVVRVAASLAGGVVLGALLEHVLGLSRSDGPLALAGFALVATLLSRLLDLEGIFVALAAGAATVNLSAARGARLRAMLHRVSVPVYAVAFTFTGAAARVGALAELWPWVLLLAGLRVVALRYGARWAGRGPAPSGDLARDAWPGLISQAGIALALAAAVRRAFPAWGVSFEALVAAIVAVHALVGPVVLRRVLTRAEERRELGDGGRASGHLNGVAVS